MKKIVYPILTFAILALISFACNEDSLNLKTSNNFLSADEYAESILKNISEFNEDFIDRNEHIIGHQDRFFKEITRFQSITSFDDLKTLVDNSAVELDVNLLRDNLELFDEIANALESKAISAEQLSDKIQLKSEELSFQPLTIQKSQLRGDRIACLKAYDRTAETIWLSLQGCVAAAALNPAKFPVTSRACAISASVALASANMTYSRCLEAIN